MVCLIILNDLPRDLVKANELYRKAGELGCTMGYYNLGDSYYDGTGIERNEKKGKHFFELAAMAGGVAARHCPSSSTQALHTCGKSWGQRLFGVC